MQLHFIRVRCFALKMVKYFSRMAAITSAKRRDGLGDVAVYGARAKPQRRRDFLRCFAIEGQAKALFLTLGKPGYVFSQAVGKWQCRCVEGCRTMQVPSSSKPARRAAPRRASESRKPPRPLLIAASIHSFRVTWRSICINVCKGSSAAQAADQLANAWITASIATRWSPESGAIASTTILKSSSRVPVLRRPVSSQCTSTPAAAKLAK